MKLVYEVKYKATKDVTFAAVDCEKKTAEVVSDNLRRAEIKVEPEYRTEKVMDNELKKEVDITIDNREELADEIVKALGKTANYQVSVHECHHESGINRPCGPWCVVAEKGILPDTE